MAQLYETIALYTTPLQEDPAPKPYTYYYDYSYAQLLDVALSYLNLPQGKEYGIVYRSSTGVPRWMQPDDTLRRLGARPGDLIHILPIPRETPVQELQGSGMRVEFTQHEHLGAVFRDANGGTWAFAEEPEGANSDYRNDPNVDVFGGNLLNGRTPQPSAASQIDLLLARKPTDERVAEIHKQGAERGLPEEQFQWAVCLQHGRGCKRDLKEAAKWFKLAGTAGNPKAMFNYAICLRDGDGVEPNMEQSLVYFKRSADKGYPPAMYAYGAFLMKGEGIERRPEEGLMYIRSAAEAGEPQAVEYMSHFR